MGNSQAAAFFIDIAADRAQRSPQNHREMLAERLESAQSGGDGSVTQDRSIVADDLASLNAALNPAIANRIVNDSSTGVSSIVTSGLQATLGPGVWSFCYRLDYTWITLAQPVVVN